MFDPLEEKARELRVKILDVAIKNGGHIASSFSCIDILVSLYYGDILQINASDAENKDRDRFILSKGHAETALFAVLSDLLFFPQYWIEMHYRTGNCYLGGHPDNKIPGVEITSGSLGHGLGIAAGISLAAKMNNKKHFQFVLMGDSECSEGSVWETALFAAKHKLNNLIAITDRNRIGSIDFTENFTSLEPLKQKWEAFGWETVEVDGHNFDELLHVLHYAKTREDSRPLSIIANTVKGKGVSFMENNPIWHVKNLSCEDEIALARKELNAK
jgi:transketolase